MTMIIAAHLKDHLLIAADRRAMSYDLVTGRLSFANDKQHKIEMWAGGIVSGTGEKVFIDRVSMALQQIKQSVNVDTLLHIVIQQLLLRQRQGIPITTLANNTIFITQYSDVDCLLYSIPIAPLIELDCISNTLQTDLFIHAFCAFEMQVTCLNVPQDFSQLQQFQANLKPIKDFRYIDQAINFYRTQLHAVFEQQAVHDSSVSPDFDLYLQDCHTGKVHCYES